MAQAQDRALLKQLARVGLSTSTSDCSPDVEGLATGLVQVAFRLTRSSV